MSISKVFSLFKKYEKLRIASGNTYKLHLCFTSGGHGWILEEYSDAILSWETHNEGIIKLEQVIADLEYAMW